MLPRETILSGASEVCDCGTKFEFEVMLSGAGYFIGTRCHNEKCPEDGMPNSRESEYMDFAEAEKVLELWQKGNFVKARCC